MNVLSVSRSPHENFRNYLQHFPVGPYQLFLRLFVDPTRFKIPLTLDGPPPPADFNNLSAALSPEHVTAKLLKRLGISFALNGDKIAFNPELAASLLDAVSSWTPVQSEQPNLLQTPRGEVVVIDGDRLHPACKVFSGVVQALRGLSRRPDSKGAVLSVMELKNWLRRWAVLLPGEKKRLANTVLSIVTTPPEELNHQTGINLPEPLKHKELDGLLTQSSRLIHNLWARIQQFESTLDLYKGHSDLQIDLLSVLRPICDRQAFVLSSALARLEPIMPPNLENQSFLHENQSAARRAISANNFFIYLHLTDQDLAGTLRPLSTYARLIRPIRDRIIELAGQPQVNLTENYHQFKELHLILQLFQLDYKFGQILTLLQPGERVDQYSRHKVVQARDLLDQVIESTMEYGLFGSARKMLLAIRDSLAVINNSAGKISPISADETDALSRARASLDIESWFHAAFVAFARLSAEQSKGV